MSTVDYTVANVLDASAALNNDAAKTQYTYAAQIPYLNIALSELQEYFQQNEMPVTQETSAVIALAAGDTEVGFATSPALPSDLVEINQLWERQHGIDPWISMTKRDYLPHNLEGVETNLFVYWSWNNQTIEVLPSNQANDLKLDYIKALFPTYTVADTPLAIGVVNAQSFLNYRTASLCARFVGEDKPRSDELNVFAGLAIDRVVSIGTKGRQSMTVRRRPFRSSLKSRGVV